MKHIFIEATNTVVRLKLKTMGYRISKDLYVYEGKNEDSYTYRLHRFDEAADCANSVPEVKKRLQDKIEAFKAEHLAHEKHKLVTVGGSDE